MIDRIHILGASGSGTTTLGAALSMRLDCAHLHSDDYFWAPTVPPYQRPRRREEARALLAAALDSHPRFVLSGSMCGWGDIVIPRLDLVVFLWVATDIRVARLAARERDRFGAEALAPGGGMHEAHAAFMNWAAAYDTAGEETRSRRLHEKWLAALVCPILRLKGPLTTEEQAARVEEMLAGGGRVQRVDH